MWLNVDKSSPCPICGKGTWCSKNNSSNVVCCRRISNGNTQYDSQSTPYWVYKPKPYETMPIDVNRSVVKQEVDRFKKHKFYSELLSFLELSPLQRCGLRNRGLSDEEIDSRGYKTIPADPNKLQIAMDFVAPDFSTEVLRLIPGVYNDKGKWRFWASLGTVIPVRDLSGLIIALKIRTVYKDAKYLWVSSKRFGGASSGSHVHVPFHKGLSLDVIRITEGELKADIATSLSNTLTISIPGATSWRTAIPVIEKINPSVVKLAFDADVETNQFVATSLDSSFTYFQQLPITVKVETWK